jgi:hypothetical protein
MKRLISIAVVFVVLILAAYLLKKYFKNDDYAVRINSFSMSLDDFEDYFAKMNAGRADTADARKGVLEALVSKKLILQEAERLGLQKSEDFLNALQHYYEQLLFKLIVDLKAKELASEINILDVRVREKYNDMVAEGLTDKSLDEIYQQIKWQLLREKQTQALNDWLNKVEEDSLIDIDYDAILSKAEGGYDEE